MRKYWRAAICVACACSLCASLFSCSLVVNKFKVETEDLNGEDDTTLAVLSEKEICAEDNDCYCVVYGFSPSGAPSYPTVEDWHDADHIEASAQTPLSGVSLLQMTYGKEDTIVFTVECQRTAGNVRIVLLDENLNIIHDFDVDKKSQHTVEDANGKTFEIRVAGESAEFTVTVSREFLAR